MNDPVYPLESYKQHALVELGNVMAGILEFDNALILANRLEAIRQDLLEYHVFSPEPTHPAPPLHLDQEFMDVMGIHVGALNIAAEEIAKLTGEPLQTVGLRLLKQGREFYELCDPQTLSDRSQSLLEAARKMDHDPIVLYDPVTGPVTDSQLTAIANQAKTDAHDSRSLASVQPPEESA
jgi:hypothetical protein